MYDLNLSMFDDTDIPSVSIPKKRRKAVVKVETPVNQDLLRILFPEDYSQEEHLSALMETDWFPWCENDVRLLQQKIAADVCDILARSNSSQAAVSECLTWVFKDDPDYDFSINQVSALLGVSTMYLQSKYVALLSRTLRQLRSKGAKTDKLAFYKKCLVKAKERIGDEQFVSLTPLEAACY